MAIINRIYNLSLKENMFPIYLLIFFITIVLILYITFFITQNYSSIALNDSLGCYGELPEFSVNQIDDLSSSVKSINNSLIQTRSLIIKNQLSRDQIKEYLLNLYTDNGLPIFALTLPSTNKKNYKKEEGKPIIPINELLNNLGVNSKSGKAIIPRKKVLESIFNEPIKREILQIARKGGGWYIINFKINMNINLNYIKILPIQSRNIVLLCCFSQSINNI